MNHNHKTKWRALTYTWSSRSIENLLISGCRLMSKFFFVIWQTCKKFKRKMGENTINLELRTYTKLFKRWKKHYKRGGIDVQTASGMFYQVNKLIDLFTKCKKSARYISQLQLKKTMLLWPKGTEQKILQMTKI